VQLNSHFESKFQSFAKDLENLSSQLDKPSRVEQVTVWFACYCDISISREHTVQVKVVLISLLNRISGLESEMKPP